MSHPQGLIFQGFKLGIEKKSSEGHWSYQLKPETFLRAVFRYGENLGAFLCHQNRVLKLR